jgi:hypothetical protein
MRELTEWPELAAVFAIRTRWCSRHSMQTQPATYAALVPCSRSSRRVAIRAISSALDHSPSVSVRPQTWLGVSPRSRAPAHYSLGGDHPTFTIGVGVLAYTLGLRHAFDADHIAAASRELRTGTYDEQTLEDRPGPLPVQI